MEDWQDQVQELQALTAIYGDDFVVPGVTGSGESDDAQFEALAQQPPPAQGIEAQLLIQLGVPQSPFNVQVSSIGSLEPFTAQVAHLPPLSLQLELPPDYPSTSPPAAGLSAFWLTPEQLAQLQRHLAQLWQDQAGSPICFAWADWLASSALEQLGISHTLTLHAEADGQPHSEQPTAHAPLSSSAQSANGSHSLGSSAVACRTGSQPSASPAAQAAHRQTISEQTAAASTSPPAASGGMHAGSSQPAASSLPRSAETVLMQLLQYNARREAELFCQQQWTCKICLEEVSGSRCLCGAACAHFFCRDCLAQHASSLLSEGIAERLQCPEPGCKQPLLQQTLAPLLTAEEGARWEKLELDSALLRMADVAVCKRCGTHCLEDADNCAMCSKCLFVFCSLCQESWHPGTQCMSPATRLKILRERMAGNKASAHSLVQQEFELMSLTAIEKSSKACPVCGMAIQKQEGCNKMTCGSCGAYFCYRCNKPISGYEHFRDGGCVLFELSDIMRWEHELQDQINRHMGIRPEIRQPARALDDRNQSTCPRCGQGNARMSNNNHMACWACQQHYCFLCRAVLGRKGGGLHFSRRGGCQQHTGPALAA